MRYNRRPVVDQQHSDNKPIASALPVQVRHILTIPVRHMLPAMFITSLPSIRVANEMFCTSNEIFERMPRDVNKVTRLLSASGSRRYFSAERIFAVVDTSEQ